MVVVVVSMLLGTGGNDRGYYWLRWEPVVKTCLITLLVVVMVAVIVAVMVDEMVAVMVAEMLAVMVAVMIAVMIAVLTVNWSEHCTIGRRSVDESMNS